MLYILFMKISWKKWYWRYVFLFVFDYYFSKLVFIHKKRYHIYLLSIHFILPKKINSFYGSEDIKLEFLC